MATEHRQALELEQTTQRDVRPVPDPTALTTDQLRREIAALRDVIETRLGGMDKAIELVRAAAEKFPQLMADKIGQLQQLHDQKFGVQDEKFRSIQTQFSERDTRTDQTSKDSKVAVDAALQAAKEAVGEQNKSNALAIAKSEAAFTKQIDQIIVLLNTMGKGFDEKIDDVKLRQNTMEAHGKGLSDGWGYIVGALGVLIALAVFAMNLFEGAPH